MFVFMKQETKLDTLIPFTGSKNELKANPMDVALEVVKEVNILLTYNV